MKTRVAIIETTGNVIRGYGTQPVMKLILNQPIMSEIFKNTIKPAESDGLTESATEESAKKSSTVQDEPVKGAKKRLRNYKSMARKLKCKVKDKVTNSKVVKSKATAVVMSLAKVSRLSRADKGTVPCTAQGKGKSDATDSVSWVDVDNFKIKEERENWNWKSLANVDPMVWMITNTSGRTQQR